MASLREIASHWPLLVGAVSLVTAATAAQFQINANASSLESVEADLQNRVPIFLYDRDRSQLRSQLEEFAESIEGNEVVLDELKKGTSQIDSKIELEVERLRSMIREADREQAAKLETILRLLEDRFK